MSTPEENAAKRALGFPLIEASRKADKKREENKKPAPYKNNVKEIVKDAPVDVAEEEDEQDIWDF